MTAASFYPLSDCCLWDAHSENYVFQYLVEQTTWTRKYFFLKTSYAHHWYTFEESFTDTTPCIFGTQVINYVVLTHFSSEKSIPMSDLHECACWIPVWNVKTQLHFKSIEHLHLHVHMYTCIHLDIFHKWKYGERHLMNEHDKKHVRVVR